MIVRWPFATAPVIPPGDRLALTPDRLMPTHHWLAATKDRLASTHGWVTSTHDRLTPTDRRWAATGGRLTSTDGWLTPTPSRLAPTYDRLTSTNHRMASTDDCVAERNGAGLSRHNIIDGTPHPVPTPHTTVALPPASPPAGARRAGPHLVSASLHWGRGRPRVVPGTSEGASAVPTASFRLTPIPRKTPLFSAEMSV